jgi:hypothetical protein
LLRVVCLLGPGHGSALRVEVAAVIPLVSGQLVAVFVETRMAVAVASMKSRSWVTKSTALLYA